MQLLGIITLYFSAFGFGTLLFQIINIYFPDILTNDYFSTAGYYNGLRWALATLIVVFPVYVWTSWFVSKEETKIPEKRELRTRKWLLYFTVFAAAGVIIGDLIALIYNFLQGELTTRFVLKIITVLIIAAAIFGYYLWVLRRDVKVPAGLGIKIFSWSVIAVVVIAIIAGFFVAGSPQAERIRRLDQRRVENLQNIQSQIIFFWQQKNRLPNTVDELRDSISGYVPPRDPKTGASYEYRVLGELKFELCADFKTESRENVPSRENVMAVPQKIGPASQSIESENWQHGIGRSCFERTIDPAIWKPTR